MYLRHDFYEQEQASTNLYKKFCKKIKNKTGERRTLAKIVRKCTVLYDKSRAGFGDKRKTLLVFNDVARTVGLPDGM